MLKKIIIFLTLILSFCNLSLATSKTYTLTKDYGYLSFDGVVLTPPHSVRKTLWEVDNSPFPDSFLNKYKNSKGTSVINKENHISSSTCADEIRESLYNSYQKTTNYGHLIYFPATNAELCSSVGDYPVESAYAKAKEFLKDFNPNFNYYLYSSVGMTTDMVNQSIEDIKKDKENEHFIKIGKIKTNHLNFFKTYYRFDFTMEYNGLPIFPLAPRTICDLDIAMIVSKDGIEFVDLPDDIKFKEESNSIPIISLEEVLERLNKLEEIESKVKNEYFSKKNYFKAEVGWGAVKDDYGNNLFSGVAYPLWRLGYIYDDIYLLYDYVDAQTGELFHTSEI